MAKKYLSSDQVVEIRERHKWLRGLREDFEVQETMTDTDIDNKVAEEFMVSASHGRDIVMGVVHPDAGGPLDTIRSRRRELYRAEREALGDSEARRRMNLRTRGIDPEPLAVRYAQRVVILDSRGRETGLETILEPGQSIRVDMVAQGVQA